MQYYFAPLEGLTDSIYRKLHHKYFPGVDRYYTPFLSPTVHRSLTPREQRELPKSDAVGFSVVPQVLTKVAEDFLWLAEVCKDYGYDEVNLNLGCPSGTVTAKGKGSGMLRDLDGLDRFLEEIFSAAPLPISVKTRIGFDSAEEFQKILPVLERYPIRELTVHPRVRTAFYKGSVDMDSFRFAVRESRIPLCYNGSLFSLEDCDRIAAEFPSVQAVMLGRGLIADPGMFTSGGTTAAKLEAFHDELLEAYTEAFGGSRNAMFRLKENWRYWLCRFADSEKLGKQLRKATDLTVYKSITHEIFHNLPLQPLQPDWE